MEHYDDALPARKFDNFQFVDYNRVIMFNQAKPDVGFATAALMEIPGTYYGAACSRRSLLCGCCRLTWSADFS